MSSKARTRRPAGSVGTAFAEPIYQLVGDRLAAPGQWPEAMEPVALGGAVTRPAAREALAGKLGDYGADAASRPACETPGREQDIVVNVDGGAHTSDAIASKVGPVRGRSVVSERRPPAGIARERETSADGARAYEHVWATGSTP